MRFNLSQQCRIEGERADNIILNHRIEPHFSPFSRAIDNGVHKAVAARLQSPVSPVRAPLTPPEQARKPTIAAAPLATALPAALIALAAVVLVAAIAATIYICASWNR